MVSGCKQQTASLQNEYKVHYSLKSNKLSVGETDFHFKVSDSKGEMVEVRDFLVEGNMTHPGMVPVYGESKKIDNGQYLVTMDLTMAGDWILFISFKNAEGQIIKKELPLNGVGSAF